MRLIDKAALVEEIDRLVEVQPTNEFQPKEQNKIDWLSGKMFAINSLRVFLDTLEVKEVDMKLTLEDVSMIRQIIFDYNRQVRNEMSIPNDEEYCKEVLKRFKAQKGESV